MLTLAIPFHRNVAYLRRTVQSILAQREDRWRLVVCDDGGDTLGKAEKLLARYRDDRIRYLPPTESSGMAANWNRCLAAAETDLVALPHADDELLPDYVGHMTAAAERYPPAAVLFCEARVIGPSSRRVFSFPDYCKRFFRPAHGRAVTVRGSTGLRAVMRADFIMCPTMCYRMSRLREIRFDPRWRQVLDLDLIARLLLAGESLMGLPDVLYAYRRHAGNATADHTRSLVRFHEERDLFREVAAAARAKGWPHAAATADHLGIVKLNLGFCFAQDLLRGRWRQAGPKARLLAELLA